MIVNSLSTCSVSEFPGDNCIDLRTYGRPLTFKVRVRKTHVSHLICLFICCELVWAEMQRRQDQQNQWASLQHLRNKVFSRTTWFPPAWARLFYLLICCFLGHNVKSATWKGTQTNKGVNVNVYSICGPIGPDSSSSTILLTGQSCTVPCSPRTTSEESFFSPLMGLN